MIDIAVIASTPHLEHLSVAGSIDLALTQIVLDDPAYAAYFRGRAAAGVTVILDNGAYELEHSTGAGMSAAPVLTAARRIGAQVVVCQDIPFDGAATVDATRRFLDEALHTDNSTYRFMGVPQGATRCEWLDCYQRLVDLPEIDLIGLSKLSVPRCFGAPVAEARLRCVADLLSRGAVKPLHLLGGDRSLPWQLARHRRLGHELVSSNDSSFAFWYAANGIRVDPQRGRADRVVETKPELAGSVLDGTRLGVALSHVALLRNAAGLPAHTSDPTQQKASPRGPE